MDSIELVVVPLVAVVAIVVTALVKRVVTVPLVVFEILLGIVVGPSLLGWVGPSHFTERLSDFGVAMLFFMAGLEIDFAQIKGRSLNRAIGGWVVSLVLGIGVGLLVGPTITTAVFIGVGLGSTALGTISPVLRDAGELSTPFGKAVTAVGAAGEFGPLVAISLFLSGRQPGVSALVLLAFVVLAGLAIAYALRGNHARLHALSRATLHTSGQFAVRLVVVIVAGLVALSLAFGLDMLLGAFAGGVLWRALTLGAEPADRKVIEQKLDALAFGFLVPIFFITTGVTFDLRELLDSPATLALVPVFVVGLLVVRGLPALWAAPPGATRSDKASIALFGATALPIIVAVTNIGRDRGLLSAGTATALVAAGMLSVLVFPALALFFRARSTRSTA